MPDAHALYEKIRSLPPERLGEVEDFIDFLSAKSRRLAALDMLLAIAPAIEATNAPGVTDDDLQADVDAVRSLRRLKPNSATSS